jgi:hypothetical protein
MKMGKTGFFFSQNCGKETVFSGVRVDKIGVFSQTSRFSPKGKVFHNLSTLPRKGFH